MDARWYVNEAIIEFGMQKYMTLIHVHELNHKDVVGISKIIFCVLLMVTSLRSTTIREECKSPRSLLRMKEFQRQRFLRSANALTVAFVYCTL